MLSNQRIIFILFFGLTTALNTTAQQLQGRVTNERGFSMEGVTVINSTEKMGTVTNVRGRYSIGFTVGDTLKFSSIGYQDFTLVMEAMPRDLNNVNITLTPASTELEEVVVNSDQISEAELQRIIDQNFGAITPERKWTQTERRAYTASTSGGGIVSFDYILNLINGRIKRIKTLSNWERQDAAIGHLQEMLPEGFFQEKLGLEEEEVYPFLLYCMETSQRGMVDEMLNLDLMEYFLVNLEAYKANKD